MIVAMLPTAIVLTNSLTVGDLIVGVGTAALAVFTAILARVTVRLDKQRHERELRGIARLLDGELELIKTAIEDAVQKGSWWVYNLASPSAAWDRGGGVVAAALPEHEAVKLIDIVEKLRKWEVVTRLGRDLSFALNPKDVEFLSGLVPRLSESREFLRPLAHT